MALERFEAICQQQAVTSRASLTAEEQTRVAAYSSHDVAAFAAGSKGGALRSRGVSDQYPDATGSSRNGRQLRIAYIVGAKNCGSTMLDALIGQAEGARSLGEVGGFPRFVQGGLCDCGRQAAACEPCRAVVTGLDQSGDSRRFQGLFRLSAKERRIYWALVRTWTRHQYAQISDRLFSLVAEATGSWLLIDSSKNISRAAALAFDSEHDVRVIHLIRDGRGFSASRRRRAELDMQSHRPVLALVEWLAKNLAIMVLLRFRLSEDRYLLCRYEDLLADPETALCRIGGFLGVDLSGVGAYALTEGVHRAHLFEPPRRVDYGLIRLEPGRLASQRWSGARNLAYWWCGGFVSAVWHYDRAQSYLDRAGRGRRR